MEHLIRLKNLESFEIGESDPFSGDAVWYQLTTLKNLRTIRGFSDIPIEVWAALKNTETFSDRLVSYMDDERSSLTANWTNLRELAMQFYRASSPLDIVTNAHSKLTSLEIDFGTDLGQCWTDEDLQRLSNIKHLYFNTPSLYFEPKEELPALSLKHLTSLEELTTKHPIFEINSPKLSKLVLNTVTHQEKSVFPFLGSLKHFEVTVEDDMDYLAHLTNLNHLVVKKDRGAADPDHGKFTILGNITSSKLQFLALTGFQQSIEYGYLTKLGSLKRLHLTETLCDSSIATLTNLETLSLIHKDGEASDHSSVLTVVPKLTTLRYLMCSIKNTTSVSIDLSTLPNLESLSISLDAALFSGIGTLTNLTKLLLSTQFSEKVWPLADLNLLNLTNLQALFFESAGSDLIQYATALTNLQELGINSCKSDEELLSLTALSKLTALYFGDYGQANFERLTVLTGLQDLYWAEVLSDDEKEVLQSALPNLHSFYSFT